MSENPSASRRGPGNLTGLLMTAMGLFVLALGFGVIPTDPGSIHAPAWVIGVFGGTFLLAGLWVLLVGAMRQDAAGARWLNLAFAVVVLLAMSAICLWISFGPGPRAFSNTDPLTGLRTSALTDPTLGRIFFGFAGVIMSAATIAMAVVQVRKLR